ncbi:MAG: prepilin-type N-terminal cleavage/methylation domain-containing protein, partial [Planctomycetes bacterium]|nr:prepilin-type N-terminal cleavage/methylation domain-containing protein [Planctomycetota bacterium]MCP3905439.1 prepilin-type N-terminal cleavage/methylation domain-containing protein [Planctomycetota bacterium]
MKGARSIQSGRVRRAFTLVEAMVTMVVLAAIGSVASGLV